MIARVVSSEYEVSPDVKPFTLREKAVERRRIELRPIKAKIREAGE
jgi:hypothetical protein